jgi:hypothetical protein
VLGFLTVELVVSTLLLELFVVALEVLEVVGFVVGLEEDLAVELVVAELFVVSFVELLVELDVFCEDVVGVVADFGVVEEEEEVVLTVELVAFVVDDDVVFGVELGVELEVELVLAVLEVVDGFGTVELLVLVVLTSVVVVDEPPYSEGEARLSRICSTRQRLFHSSAKAGSRRDKRTVSSMAQGDLSSTGTASPNGLCPTAR